MFHDGNLRMFRRNGDEKEIDSHVEEEEEGN